MFSYIKNKYKNGDILRLKTENIDVSGEILVLNEDSLILKSYDGKIYGIKDNDISFFEELSIGAPGESDLIDKANDKLKKNEFIMISYKNLHKANKYGDEYDNYWCYEYNDEIRINIGHVNFTGKAKELKQIIDSNYNKRCEFNVDLENSENKTLIIDGKNVGLGIGEPRWWLVEILEPSFSNSNVLEEFLEEYYVLCYLTFKKGQYQFVDSLYSELKKR